MKQLVVVPVTPDRSHYLKVCLDHIRKADPSLPILIGLDRSMGFDWELPIGERDTVLHIPEHRNYGNTYAVMNLLKVAYNAAPSQFDVIHYVESDTMVKPDAFAWANRMHEEYPDSFAACGWVCNQEAPINLDDYSFAWYYAPFTSFRREMLGKVVEHCRPEYFQNMRRYVMANFPDSALHANGKQTNTKFFEQDALMQYILERDKLTCMWRRTALCHHIGAHGYNRPDGPVFTGTLDERVTKVETLLANPHLRAQMFGRAIVEREIGGPIPKRTFRYRINLPGGWQSELVSELEQRDLPIRLNSSNCYGGFIKAI
jgi:hypothetical protein